MSGARKVNMMAMRHGGGGGGSSSMGMGNGQPPQQQQQQQQHASQTLNNGNGQHSRMGGPKWHAVGVPGPSPGADYQQQQHQQQQHQRVREAHHQHQQQQQHGQHGQHHQQQQGMQNGGPQPRDGRPRQQQHHQRQHHPQNNDEMALNQKNHRLAKELSDLRVRHREETKVVSRLTMENMNLASRCREAIAQVAALKKEVSVYQKRQSEWGTLQREVMQLRKQIDKNAASSNNSNTTSKTSSINISSDQPQKQQPLTSPGNEKGGGLLETKQSVSPTTDLDRIMSQKFQKQDSSTLLAGDKSEESVVRDNGLAKKFQDLRVSTSDSSHSSSKADPSSNNNKQGSSSSTSNLTTSNTKIPISVKSSSVKSIATSQTDDEFDADIDMVDFFAKSQQTGNVNGSSASAAPSGKLASVESIPSTHLGSRTHHTRKSKGTDDHMPGDVVSVSPTQHHQKELLSSPGDGSGPNNAKKTSPPPISDNLLNSLDAFEASFASAFPETSFSITSEGPLSSANLDMSFDVPDFDPFFKSPSNKDASSASSAGGSVGNVSIGAHGASSSQGGDKNSSNGTTMKSQMIQDLFPESAMNFKTSPTLAFDSNPMSFDTPKEMNETTKKGSGSAGATAVAPEKLDHAFSRVAQPKGKSNNPTDLMTQKEEKPAASQKRRGANQYRSSALSPQSKSAEIEQLDVLANLATSEKTTEVLNVNSVGTAGGGATAAANPNSIASSRSASTRSSARRVKQPVSYAEPSTKSKLRRGDVIFPKADAADKQQQKKVDLESIRSSSKGGGTTSPTTDLDRIMNQMASTSPGVQ